MTLAWQGTKTKESTLTEFRKHIELDTLVAQTYGDIGRDGVWRGCAVGCLTGGRYHERYPVLYGIPEQLAYLHDVIFEGLSRTDAKAGQQWSYRFLEVIEQGADLSTTFSQLVVVLFEDEQHGLLKLYPDNKYKTTLIQVVELHKRIITGGAVTENEWRNAAYVARAAAYAARAADAAAYAAYAADAADAYAADAARAAYAADAADADAADAARAIFWQWLSEQLLIILAHAPLVESAP